VADEKKPRKSNAPRLRFDGGAKAIGRPRTKLEDLPENWKQIMMEEARNGGSAVAWKVKLGIGHTAYDTLIEDYEEFRSTVETCKMLSQLWHETVGRNMMVGANGNAVVWKFAMQNQFGWRDRQQLSGDPEAPIQQSVTVKNQSLSKEELIAELQARGLPTEFLKDCHGLQGCLRQADAEGRKNFEEAMKGHSQKVYGAWRKSE